MRGKYDLHPSLFILCQLLLLLALIHGCHPTARRHNWIFFIPISTLCIYSSFFCASNSVTFDYPFIQVFINLIPTSTDYILLRYHHQPELRKIGQKKSTAEMSFTERLAWALSLLSTSRGIGWAHEPTSHIPTRPTSSRRTFILSQTLWIIPRYILFDAALIHIRQNPCYRTGGPSLGAFGWGWRTTAWVFIVSIYCSMSNLYAALSIVAVATGLYEPRDWPPLFGSPLDAYTVRNCWGYVLTHPNLPFPIIEKYDRQPRMAPNAPQDSHHQLQLPRHLPPSPTPTPLPPNNLLQTIHLVPHFRAHPCDRRLRPLPHIFQRRRSPIFPPPSGGYHVRGRCHRYLLPHGIQQDIHILQGDRLHLGIRMVHVFYADMVRPAGARGYRG